MSRSTKKVAEYLVGHPSIESIATIPAISTHQQQGEESRALAGVPANMVRLCVGAEHPTDIITDLDQALHAAKKS